MSTHEPDRESLIEALAALDALSVKCSNLGERGRELDSEAQAIGTQLRIAAFGPAPEDAQGQATDPVSVAVFARSEELRGHHGSAASIREHGNILKSTA